MLKVLGLARGCKPGLKEANGVIGKRSVLVLKLCIPRLKVAHDLVVVVELKVEPTRQIPSSIRNQLGKVPSKWGNVKKCNELNWDMCLATGAEYITRCVPGWLIFLISGMRASASSGMITTPFRELGLQRSQ